MAGVTDSYTLKLLDQITAPLRRIEAHASRLNNTMERLQKLAEGGAGLVKLVGIAGGAIAALGALKWAFSGVASVLGQGAELAWDFSKAIVEATRFRVQNITSFEMFLGRGKGEATFDKLLQVGGITPMDERAVVKQGQSLASAGYKDRGLWAVNAALADVEAARGEAYRANLEFHFLRLKNESKPDARDVKMAAIDTGVGMEGIMRQIFKLQGVKAPKTLHAMEEMYENMKKSGKVGGSEVADAILHAIEERYDQGKGLGSFAKLQGAGTLTGLISNLQAAPMRFLMQMKLESLPGIQSLMVFLRKLAYFFDHATPAGQKLAAIVERLTNALFGGLDKITGEDLERFFEAGVAVAERFVKLVEKAWELLAQILHGDWSGVLSAASGAVVAVGQLLGQGIYEGVKLAMSGAVNGIGTSATQALVNTAQVMTRQPEPEVFGQPKKLGLIDKAVGWADESVNGRQPSLGEALAEYFVQSKSRKGMEQVGADLAEGTEVGARRQARSHSPSEAMAEVGEDLVDGFIVGIKRRMADRMSGPGAETLQDEMIEYLRAGAQRMGARVL